MSAFAESSIELFQKISLSEFINRGALVNHESKNGFSNINVDLKNIDNCHKVLSFNASLHNDKELLISRLSVAPEKGKYYLAIRDSYLNKFKVSVLCESSNGGWQGVEFDFTK